MKQFEEEETITLSDGITIKLSQLEAHNRRKAARQQEEFRRQREAVRNAPKGICPFKSGSASTCTGDACALFTRTECALHRLGAQNTTEAATDNTKRKCPFMGRTCGEICSLHTGAGCAITALANNLRKE